MVSGRCVCKPESRADLPFQWRFTGGGVEDIANLLIGLGDPRRRGNRYPEYQYDIPIILREGPYRVYFYSHDLNEPAHVHVDRDDRSAKFWLDPVSLASNLGFKPKELRVIEKLLVENEGALLDGWREHMGSAQ